MEIEDMQIKINHILYVYSDAWKVLEGMKKMFSNGNGCKEVI